MKSRTGTASANAVTTAEGLPNVRAALTTEAFTQALLDNLRCVQAKSPRNATRNDWYMALAYTVRDRLLDRFIKRSKRCFRRIPRSRSSPICRPSS